MGLLDKIKAVFTKQQVPDETRLLLEGVENVHELRRGLDEIVTRNEVELKEVEREIDRLEKLETSEKEKVKTGSLAEREKKNTLLAVRRLRSRMESYQKRHKIHEDNIDLHLSLLDKIDEMEAMELKAVKQEQIDAIAEDYDERLEKHKEIVRAGRIAAEQEDSYEDMHEKRELEQLEKEILSEGNPKESPAAEAVKEKAAAEPPKTEAPAPERAARAPLEVEDEDKPAPLPKEARENQVPKVVPTERRLETE